MRPGVMKGLRDVSDISYDLLSRYEELLEKIEQGQTPPECAMHLRTIE